MPSLSLKEEDLEAILQTKRDELMKASANDTNMDRSKYQNL
jgi:hypothetical protein